MYKEKDRKLWVKLALSFLGIVLFFGIWELVVRVGLISMDKLPSPSKLVETFIDKLNNPIPDGNTILVHLFISLRLVVLGFLVSCIIGIPLGLVMGYFNVANKLLSPVFEMVRPIPPLAWIPIVIVLFGIGLESELFIIFIAAFVPCVINSYTGIKATNRTLINVAKTAGASKMQIFFKVAIPSALPMVFTGIKVSFGSAWATLVAAEMIASSEGLGYMIGQGRVARRADIVVLGMMVIGLVGALLTSILGKLEDHALPWRKIK